MKKGQILVIAVIFMTVILVLTTSLFSRVANYVLLGSNSIVREQATNLAEAGIENTLWQLNQTAGVCGTCQNETTVGTTGSFKVTITNKTSSLKTIASKGCIPNCTNPRASRTVKADVAISSNQIAFRYAVQTGDGGVTMANSATINGTIYTNGSITGSGSSQINGEAYAFGTISSPDPTVSCPLPNCKYEGAPEVDLPDITNDVKDWKDAAEAGTNCSPTNDITYSTTIGPCKYESGLTISNNAKVIISGPIWVTGNVSVSQGGTEVNLASSYGSNGTGFVVDGTVSISQGASFNPTAATPKGYILVVSNSTSDSAVSIANAGANAVFYALQGGAELSQSAHVSSLVAKRLSMQNSATLDYETGLASAQFSSGPGASWQIKKGTYRFTSSL